MMAELFMIGFVSGLIGSYITVKAIKIFREKDKSIKSDIEAFKTDLEVFKKDAEEIKNLCLTL